MPGERRRRGQTDVAQRDREADERRPVEQADVAIESDLLLVGVEALWVVRRIEDQVIDVVDGRQAHRPRVQEQADRAGEGRLAIYDQCPRPHERFARQFHLIAGEDAVRDAQPVELPAALLDAVMAALG